jgi:hypothetical protein
MMAIPPSYEDWNLNRWEARGSVPAVTREQLDKIKARY